jgi:hypothetical protein
MKIVRNHGLSGGTVVENPPLPIPVVVYENCDVDPACDRAKFEVFVGELSLFFCAHHYRQHSAALDAQGFGVRPLS